MRRLFGPFLFSNAHFSFDRRGCTAQVPSRHEWGRISSAHARCSVDQEFDSPLGPHHAGSEGHITRRPNPADSVQDHRPTRDASPAKGMNAGGVMMSHETDVIALFRFCCTVSRISPDVRGGSISRGSDA